MSRQTSEYWEARIANSTWRKYNDIEKQSRDILQMYRKAAYDISAELYAIEKQICKDGFLDEALLNRYGRLKKINASFAKVLKGLEKSTTKEFFKKVSKGMQDNYKSIVGELGIDLNLPNLRFFEELAKEPWRGEDFSKRIWRNMDKLLVNLKNTLVSGMIRGKSITEMALELDELMNRGFHNAHRLVRTETMHYLNASSLQAYKDCGVKYVQFWAALDERTCTQCGTLLHGRIFEIDKAPVLPIHPNCRCCYLPVIDRKMIADYLAQKAQNPEFMLPNVYFEKALDAKLEKSVIGQITGYDEWTKGLQKPYRNQLGNIWDKTDIKIRDDTASAMIFDSKHNVIILNPTHPDYKKYIFNQAITHELAHQIDTSRIHSWNQEEFTYLIDVEREHFMEKAFEVQNKIFADETLKNDVMLSDILDIVSNGRLRLITGHPVEYYEADVRRRPAEVFANMYALCSENKAVDFLENYLYDILKAFKELIKEA